MDQTPHFAAYAEIRLGLVVAPLMTTPRAWVDDTAARLVAAGQILAMLEDAGWEITFDPQMDDAIALCRTFAPSLAELSDSVAKVLGTGPIGHAIEIEDIRAVADDGTPLVITGGARGISIRRSAERVGAGSA